MISPFQIVAFVACAAGGYFVARPGESRLPQKSAASDFPPPQIEMPPMTAAESPLIAEWERLREQHGGAAADLSALYTAVKDIEDPFRRRALRSAIIGEWAKADPSAAMAYLLAKDAPNARQLAREWLQLDPQAAIAGLLAGGDKMRELLGGMLNEVARAAPGQLAQVVSALPKGPERWDTRTLDAFAILAKADPAAARAAAESIMGPWRSQALAGVARAWGEKDGAAALAWAQAMPAGEGRDAALKAVLVGWAKTDPVAALERIDLAPPGGEYNYYASDTGAQVLAEAAKKDWDGTLNWLRDHPGKLGSSSFDGLQSAVSHRLSVDAAGTMRTLAQSGIVGIGNTLANSFLNEGYGQRDAIWTWLDGQPSTPFTLGARGSLLNAIAWKEPMNALGFIEKIPDTAENRPVIQQGTSSLLNGGSRMYLLEDLLAKASPGLRAPLIEAALNFNQGNLPGSPETWIARANELPAERRAIVYSGLARSWAAQDPEATLKWAAALPDASQRSSAFGAAIGTWAGAEPAEAAQWVNTLPPGADRDQGASNLALALSASRPESAWEWALSIQDATSRNGALRMAYSALNKKDPAVAAQMLQSANLPPSEAEALKAGAAAKPSGPLFISQ